MEPAASTSLSLTRGVEKQCSKTRHEQIDDQFRDGDSIGGRMLCEKKNKRECRWRETRTEGATANDGSPPHPTPSPHSSSFLHTTGGYVGHQLINVCQCVRSKKYDFRERSVAAKTRKRRKVRAKGRLKQTGERRGKHVGRLDRPRRLSATAKRSG